MKSCTTGPKGPVFCFFHCFLTIFEECFALCKTVVYFNDINISEDA